MTRFDVFARMLESLGYRINPGTAILDFGCGSGELVKAAAERGLDAYGCDIDFSSEWVDQGILARLKADGKVRGIEGASGKASPSVGEHYRLPFEDGSFDVVISDQVFEHVANYSEALDELKRVTRPGAVMLHIFPSRYRPIEPHIFVPLASCFHPRWWLKFWAWAGVRNEWQRALSDEQTVEQNTRFLATMVNYLRGSQIRQAFERHFITLNAESKFMSVSRNARAFLLPAIYRTVWARCLFCARK